MQTERRWWMWFVAGFVAGPIATLVHELGHYVTARILGMPGALLHISSVSYTGSSEIDTLLQTGQRAQAAQFAALWKVALVEAGGPLISLLLLGAAILFRRRWLPGAVATGLATSLHFVAPTIVAGVLLLRAIGGNHTPLGANVDEFNAARALDVNPLLVILPVVLAVVAGLFMLAAAIPRSDRVRLSFSLATGLAVSMTLYLGVLGPMLP